jgi:hypothetical protein
LLELSSSEFLQRMIDNLQDRIRLNEQTSSREHPDLAPASSSPSPALSLSPSVALPISSMILKRTWSSDELQRVKTLFLERFQSHAHSGGSNLISNANSVDTSSRTRIIPNVRTFRADYFCSWITTDSDASQFSVTLRSDAVACGWAMLRQKVPHFV